MPTEIPLEYQCFLSPTSYHEFMNHLGNAEMVLKKCVKSREQALALTKLDEARMWAQQIGGGSWPTLSK